MYSKENRMAGKTAGIVVDMQGDFTELKHGPLAAKETDQRFFNEVQEATRELKERGLPVIATQDWHPFNHVSFHTNHRGKGPFDVISIDGRSQVLWPPHCVQDTEGAQLLLEERLFDAIVKKGTDPRYDSYSGFKDDGGKDTVLHEILQARAITRIIVYGVATDYCVKLTALDAVERGYTVAVVKNLIRGVEPATSKQALEEMEDRGIAVHSGLADIIDTLP
jgi:nicotinamidase/pyrazinamidase